MKFYEAVAIINPDLVSENIIKENIQNLAVHIQSYSTRKKVQVEDLGEKQLAYELKGHKTGYYALFRFEASEHKYIEDLESYLRSKKYILKFIVVNITEYDKEDINLEDLPEEETEQKMPDMLDVLLGRVKI